MKELIIKYQDIRGHASNCMEKETNLIPSAQRYGREMSNPHPQAKVIWLSYKERRVDALALRADERRDKLR